VNEFEPFVIRNSQNDLQFNRINYITCAPENFVNKTNLLMSDNVKNACKMYSDNWDRLINGYLRNRDYFRDQVTIADFSNPARINVFGPFPPNAISVQEKIAIIEYKTTKSIILIHDAMVKKAFVSKADEQLILFRAMDVNIFQGQALGATYDYKNFISSSIDINIAVVFCPANGFLYRMTIDPGIPYISMTADYSLKPYEDEFLLIDGTIWTMTNITPNYQHRINDAIVTLIDVRISYPNIQLLIDERNKFIVLRWGGYLIPEPAHIVPPGGGYKKNMKNMKNMKNIKNIKKNHS